MADRGVSLKDIVRALDLLPIFKADSYDSVRVTTTEVNRPGMQLAGFYDYFHPQRIQMIGGVERAYLLSLSEEDRFASIDRLFASGIQVIIIANMYVSVSEILLPTFLECAKKYNVNLFKIQMVTSEFMTRLIIYLHKALAPRTTMHGVLLEVHGEGVLITGDSGVGKSETAMSLINRGHRLVADDAVEISCVDGILIGEAPEMIRYFMEVRGIGVVDARHLFGIGSVKPSKQINLVVHFETWDTEKVYDRLGIEQHTQNILGVDVPLNIIPVRPGRDLASIIELAALSNREKAMGYNAAEVLVSRYNQMVDDG